MPIKRLILTFFVASSLGYAGQIIQDKGFQSIVAQKANDSKILLMIYTAKSCPQCAYMKQKVFQDAEVKAYMDRYFVVLEKDIHQDELPDGFGYFGIPTMFFIDREGKEIGKVIGSSRPGTFLKTLETIRDKNR